MPRALPPSRRTAALAAGIALVAAAGTAAATTTRPATTARPAASPAGPVGLHRLQEAQLLALPQLVAQGLATDLGAVDPGTAVQTAVTVARPSPAAEQAFTRAVEDPASPSYRQFLTPAQFDARFGVPAATYSGVRDWALGAGLHPVTEVGSRDYLLLAGTAAQVEQTYAVSLHRFSVAGHTIMAATGAPLVPAAVAGVLGLDTAHGAHTDAHLQRTQPAGAQPQQGLCTAVCTGPLDIEDFTDAYDLPAGQTGQGQTMAVFGEGAVDPVIADLRTFETEHKLPQVPVQVRSVGDDFVDTAGSGEWDLDTQSSTGIATGAAGEYLYFGKDLFDASINATYARWADAADGPLQANASFGECEPIPPFSSLPNGGIFVTDPTGLVGSAGIGTQSLDAYAAQEAQLGKARAEGRTLFASAGDQGGACAIGILEISDGTSNTLMFSENNGVPELNVPAGSINATAVGGTVLYTNSDTDHHRAVERALDASGGGSSTFIHADTDQAALAAGITPQLQPCLAHQDATPDTSGAVCRSTPDIAADSGDITVVAGGSGLNIVSDGEDSSAAGTSLSSPLTMGMWTRIQGALAARTGAGGLGFANPVLYRLGADAARDPRDFYDVTLGSNGQRVALPRSPLDPTGYDQITGLGVLDVANDVADLLATVPTGTPIAGSPAPGTGAPTAPATPGTGSAAPYRTTTLRVGGRGPVKTGVKRVYTLRLFVDPGAGTAPTYAGRPLGFYVDGHIAARLVTGKDGTIKYTYAFTKGQHTVSAVFYGTPDLRKATSPGQKVRAS